MIIKEQIKKHLFKPEMTNTLLGCVLVSPWVLQTFLSLESTLYIMKGG